MADDFDREELLKLWAEIDALQAEQGEKIPPQVRALTEAVRRVVRDDIGRTLQGAFPGLRVVDAAEDASRMPPRASLLCPECGGECRLIRDEGALAQVHLVNPHRPYCPACDWVGTGSRGLAGRLGARP